MGANAMGVPLSVIHEEIVTEQETLARSLRHNDPGIPQRIASLRAIRLLLVKERALFEGDKEP
jgi:hypothetical protein